MPDRLRIGLLQAGYVQPTVAATHGDYPQLFEQLLGPFNVRLTTTDVQRDGVPTSSAGQDAWIISGSASSAYEDEQWIRDLEGFAQGLMADQAPLVGICFGHQVLATATGGRVERAAVGWGVGVHDYTVLSPEPAWTGGAEGFESVRMVASHRDQVVEPPPGAEVWLTSEFCPNAGYLLGANAMTIQAHPEFTSALSQELLDVRRELIGPERVSEAEKSLRHHPDSSVVAEWITTFLRQ